MRLLRFLSRLTAGFWMVLAVLSAGTVALITGHVLWPAMAGGAIALALWIHDNRFLLRLDTAMFRGRRGEGKRWTRTWGGGLGPATRRMAARREAGTQIMEACLSTYVRMATRLVPVAPRDDQLADPRTSRFGGRPYAEAGDDWPICPKTAHPLDFILQVHQADLPESVKLPVELIVFFYCHEAWPRGGEDDEEGQWVARFYDAPSEAKAVALNRPAPREDCKYTVSDYTVQPRSIDLVEVPTVPDELHMKTLEPETWAASQDPRAWYSDVGAYHAARKRLGIPVEPGTMFGGWLPHLQAAWTDDSEPAPPGTVLFVPGEDDAGLEWACGGYAYLYLHENTAELFIEID